MSNLDRFKLNGLVTPLNGTRNFLFVINFNLPEEQLGNSAELLATVRNIINDEFPDEIVEEEVYYRITASYTLTSLSTNSERLWQGSFQPRTTQDQNILSNRPYFPETFVTEAAEAVVPERVVQKLELAGVDSDWTLTGLKSVILCFQVKCKYATHLFRPDSPVIPPSRINEARQQRSLTFERLLD